jgi:hypothetical protein
MTAMQKNTSPDYAGFLMEINSECHCRPGYRRRVFDVFFTVATSGSGPRGLLVVLFIGGWFGGGTQRRFCFVLGLYDNP